MRSVERELLICTSVGAHGVDGQIRIHVADLRNATAGIN